MLILDKRISEGEQLILRISHIYVIYFPKELRAFLQAPFN